MSMYDEFREDENATIIIKANGTATTDTWGNIVPAQNVIIFNNKGIFYELSATEKVARSQIQKTATGQIILDPLRVTTPINETMSIYVTTADKTDKRYRMVTDVNPLNKNEAIIIDIAEN